MEGRLFILTAYQSILVDRTAGWKCEVSKVLKGFYVKSYTLNNQYQEIEWKAQGCIFLMESLGVYFPNHRALISQENEMRAGQIELRRKLCDDYSVLLYFQRLVNIGEKRRSTYASIIEINGKTRCMQAINHFLANELKRMCLIYHLPPSISIAGIALRFSN